MKKQITIISAAMLLLASLLTACSKDKVTNPAPVEQELITTLSLHISDSTIGFQKHFSYRVENGFGTGSGNIEIDTVKLEPNHTYNVIVSIANEQTSPAEDVTGEVINENTEHLFLYNSSPLSGAGSISTSDGSKDDNGKPFNQTINFTTGASGNGSLIVTLKHQPTNKDAGTIAGSGGETDAEATFPVVIQ